MFSSTSHKDKTYINAENLFVHNIGRPVVEFTTNLNICTFWPLRSKTLKLLHKVDEMPRFFHIFVYVHVTSLRVDCDIDESPPCRRGGVDDLFEVGPDISCCLAEPFPSTEPLELVLVGHFVRLQLILASIFSRCFQQLRVFQALDPNRL